MSGACLPRKAAVYSGIVRRFSRPRAARHRADAEIAGMSRTPTSSNEGARAVFLRGGSVPPFRRQRRRCWHVLALALWVQCFMTALAHSLQLPPASVVDRQREIRPITEMLHMVDDARSGVHTAPLTLLTLVVVHAQHVPAELPPLRPRVKFMLAACIKQPPQLRETPI